MKIIYQFLSILLFCSFAIHNWNCTENPLNEDKTIQSNTISGKVELSDNASPDSVYVWFKVFDMSTRTDENGMFEITLPPSSAQAAGGLNGVFSLYFYVANYRIDSVEVVLVNGNIRKSVGGLNDKGELTEPLQLIKILDIDTRIDQPVFTRKSSPDTVIFTFNVRAMGKPVWLTSHVSSCSQCYPEFMTGFLKKIDADTNFIKKVTLENRAIQTPTFQITNITTRLERMYLAYDPGMQLPVGEYDAIPYLIIHQENLPAGLIESIGENVESFNPDFLKIPLKVKNNKFIVRDP